MGSQRVKLTNIFTNLNEQNPSFLTVYLVTILKTLTYNLFLLKRLKADEDIKISLTAPGSRPLFFHCCMSSRNL